MKTIRLIELFAGYGSQAMALRNLKLPFEHYRVVEFDEYAIRSYNAVHGTSFPKIDIRDIKGEDLGIVDIGTMEKTADSYKIRRLTPKECYRLMGVNDEDAEKMLALNSETQCYKQAGNSIVVQVLEAIFRRMFIDTEPIKGEQMDITDFL